MLQFFRKWLFGEQNCKFYFRISKYIRGMIIFIFIALTQTQVAEANIQNQLETWHWSGWYLCGNEWHAKWTEYRSLCKTMGVGAQETQPEHYACDIQSAWLQVACHRIFVRDMWHIHQVSKNDWVFLITNRIIFISRSFQTDRTVVPGRFCWLFLTGRWFPHHTERSILVCNGYCLLHCVQRNHDTPVQFLYDKSFDQNTIGLQRFDL